MNEINTPYRHHEFNTPQTPPFNSAGRLLWPTLVGTFLRPIIQKTDMVYWFCNHGVDFQFCFAHNDYEKIETEIEIQKKTSGITTKKPPVDGETIGMAFLGERWISKSKITDPILASKRSQLILAFLHSTCTLYLDSIVPVGNHWMTDPLVSSAENNKSENPLGNGFESLMHLVSNISQAQFELRDGNRTDWMPLQSNGNTRLWL